MKIILEMDEKAHLADDALRELTGLKIFVSAICPEHKIAVIVAREGDGLDVGCALAKLQGVARMILDAANAPNEN